MDKQISEHSTSSNIFLTGTILLANLDFAGLADYALKALIGGAIWLGYKVTSDYIERKRNKKTANPSDSEN
ncbi:MAG: hypothetical protein ABI688_01910 [Bacteroidota bacterium]